ncbi:Nicotinamide riboside transporter PnuC [Legionella massiliensis]|uniref:Nicotinamide riboside transporter PnuC n=1 Tax=Legionella massiliensis TaxID=1034943 RepID=A0A078L062_9GAMM|nr:nicotinamide riboside transporter PnuC [Legionella massiliensis]CDZ78657.1 Nicotinamide riboside transporter PnuC [Legionella massiliensis]CEE14395.1 Nicotinamide riboside transporter PnuC [Legionella massiliensis]
MFLDLFGALTSILSTYYFVRLDSKAWSVGLVATSLNSLLYWQNAIYADMTLEMFYFFSNCYGWYLWRQSHSQKELAIGHLSKKQGYLLFIAVISGFLLILGLLKMFTHSNVAVLDALTTALSLAAQLLMCYKIITTWILWFFTDVLYAYMYLHKRLAFHGLMMFIYTVMAVVGYISWTRQRDNRLKSTLTDRVHYS